MAVDDSMRKLVIPPHFAPYLERHNIYEVFYDLSLSLAMDRPQDHVLYLRNKITVLTNIKQVIKIIIIAPDHVDKRELARQIGHSLEIDVISLCDIIMEDPKAERDPKRLALRFKELLIRKKMTNKGWVLYDFPRDKFEARAIQKSGMNATHIFQLVPSPTLYTPRDLWNEKVIDWDERELMKMLIDYKNRVVGLRNIYTNQIREIPIRGRRLPDVAKACVMMTKQVKIRSAAPCLPRVVLIGPRGSYRRTIAKMLSERFNMVHVDMNELLEQGKLKKNDVGKQIKQLYESNCRIYGKLIIAVLEDRLLDYDCLNKGWVLTGFPRDRLDFEILDSFDTPPNRVIFLTKDSFACIERLKKRRVHLYNGDVKTVEEIEKMGDDLLASHFIIHPSDEEKRLIFDNEIYQRGIQGMLDYCKNNCSIVDGEGTVEEIYDRVERVIIFPAPVEKPRCRRDKEKVLKDLQGAKESKKTMEAPVKEEKDVAKFVSCESVYPAAINETWKKSFDVIPDNQDIDESSIQEEEPTFSMYEEEVVGEEEEEVTDEELSLTFRKSN
ncbi:adenylate kinase 8-like [Cimex lectularius]|uniref:Adenylate kinase n=1 Tax=Cimex lectularius TaxID=79782 RepID=A0A8I6R9Y7_CIMLE|nr:adenylate kinase 8-like [Cimex lectularius]